MRGASRTSACSRRWAVFRESCSCPQSCARERTTTPRCRSEKSQTISQPYMVALICAELQLRGDERVLDVGTGSGYQAAVLAELAREVHSIERDPGARRRRARGARRRRLRRPRPGPRRGRRPGLGCRGAVRGASPSRQPPGLPALAARPARASRPPRDPDRPASPAIPQGLRPDRQRRDPTRPFRAGSCRSS